MHIWTFLSFLPFLGSIKINVTHEWTGDSRTSQVAVRVHKACEGSCLSSWPSVVLALSQHVCFLPSGRQRSESTGWSLVDQLHLGSRPAEHVFSAKDQLRHLYNHMLMYTLFYSSCTTFTTGHIIFKPMGEWYENRVHLHLATKR